MNDFWYVGMNVMVFNTDLQLCEMFDYLELILSQGIMFISKIKYFRWLDIYS